MIWIVEHKVIKSTDNMLCNTNDCEALCKSGEISIKYLSFNKSFTQGK